MRRKADSIGCCTSDCPDRSTECKVTCERYKAKREAQLAMYEQKQKHMDQHIAADAVQYNGLPKRRKK